MKSQKIAISLIFILITAFSYTSCKKSSIDNNAQKTGNQGINKAYKKGNLFVKVDGLGNVSNNNGHLGKVTKDGKVFKKGKQIGRINKEGKVFKNGDYIGKLTKNKVFNKSRVPVGHFKGGKIFKQKKQIGQAKNLSKEQLTMLYFFGFFQ